VRDENLPPQLPGGKTIHQRNKSTPVLSSLAHIGGIKAAAKRTAFADVSNVVKATVKDDITLGGKMNTTSKDKTSVLVKEILKPAAILKPAQRPTSGIIHKQKSTFSVLPPVVPPKDEKENEPPRQNKMVTKRATTIFKETTEPIISQSHTDPIEPHARPITTRMDSTSSTSQDLSQTEEQPSTNIPLPLPPLREVVTTCSNTNISHLPVIHHGGPVSCTSHLLPDDPVQPAGQLQNANVNNSNYVDALEHQQGASTTQSQTYLPEPTQEYWEEEEQEYYDVDYTTGRSLRVKGDNTTGSLTTRIIAPFVSAAADREIASAKALVEASRTTDDIEDEMWDTSMVAEYAEEIFAYMKEKEVSLHLQIVAFERD
jgi:G2/mitotic-specific cyclin 3/4